MAGDTAYSRTKNSLRNSLVAVGLQIVSLLIGFWSRRVFLNCLGTEVLGLNTTATSLLQFLNLVEMGIGSAIAFTLYKPIFDEDRQSIREIVALQGWLYRIVALIILAGSAVMMCFFPLIFSKTPLPIWYAYASFGVLLYSSLLGYFFNYKQVLLDACQLNYKVQLTVKLTSIFKLAAQAFAVKFFDNGYIWWLILEVVFATLTAILLTRTVNRKFPYIKENVESPAGLRHKYPSVVTKVKQLFVHKIGGFVSNQATPLLIYGFASLTLVAKYGNYLIFTTNLTYILSACFLGLTASVGNMVASDNRELTLKVFRELFSIRYLMTMVCCICLWILVEPFVSLWIGEEYILDRTTLAWMIAVFYISNSRTVVDTYINAYGLFRDVWAPVVEVILNLGLSIYLGSHYGLNGILAALAISEFIVIKLWKPFFLFRYSLDVPWKEYVRINLKHLLISLAVAAILILVANFVDIDAAGSFGVFFLYAAAVFAAATGLLFLSLYAFEPGMRNFTSRMLNLLRK